MATESRPGQRNNLDALCRFFDIDNSKRTLHGALLDAELLAEVYMAMTRGQDSLMMELDEAPVIGQVVQSGNLQPLIIQFADEAELLAHQNYLQALAKSGACLWPSTETQST
jgi:DNA polymerase-3 subunit epsilon